MRRPMLETLVALGASIMVALLRAQPPLTQDADQQALERSNGSNIGDHLGFN